MYLAIQLWNKNHEQALPLVSSIYLINKQNAYTKGRLMGKPTKNDNKAKEKTKLISRSLV